MDENTKLTIAAWTAVASVVGAVIGGGLVMLKDYLQSRWTRQSDRERWLRDTLHEIYSNSIFYLSHGTVPNLVYDGSELARTFEFKKVEVEGYRLGVEIEAQRQKWLNLLAIHHPFRGSATFEEFVKNLHGRSIKPQDVVDLAASDPRLKVDYLK